MGHKFKAFPVQNMIVYERVLTWLSALLASVSDKDEMSG